jgi:hypothetical protein
MPERTNNKGTRLPEDWQPGPQEITYIKTKRPNLTKVQTEDLIADFLDYWLSEPDPHGRKLNWPRTFFAHVRRWKPWLESQKPKPQTGYNRYQSPNDPYSNDVVL